MIHCETHVDWDNATWGGILMASSGLGVVASIMSTYLRVPPVEFSVTGTASPRRMRMRRLLHDLSVWMLFAHSNVPTGKIRAEPIGRALARGRHCRRLEEVFFDIPCSNSFKTVSAAAVFTYVTRSPSGH